MAIQRTLSVLVLMFLVVVLLAAASHSQKGKPLAEPTPVVINRTKGIAVISAVRNGAELYIAFRNDYSQNIMAYAISIGNTRVTEDFAYSGFDEAGILPGTTYEKRITFSQSTEAINIEAVFFVGGAAEGNDVVVQEIRDDRLGVRVQFERTLKLLDNYLRSDKWKSRAGDASWKSQIVAKLDAPEADSLAAFRQLQPDRPWKSLSEEARNALDNGKQHVLRNFQAIESAHNPEEAVIKLKQYYARVLRRL